VTDNSQKTSPVTILLLDDDYVDVMAVKRALKKLKIANPFVHARDGIEGLEILRKPGAVSQPFIVLLDINMPRKNGIKMLTELPEDDSLSNVVVFIVTTSNDEQDKIASYKHNIAGYIVKKQVGDSFYNIMTMLDHYWRIVELPINDSGY